MMDIQSIEENTISIFVPMVIKRRGGGHATMILPKDAQNSSLETKKPNYDHRMINALAKAYKWQRQMDKQGLNISQLAAKENISDRYVSRILRLNYLAPDIVISILEGKHPRGLRLEDLTRRVLPYLWEEQKALFDFK